MRVFSVFFALLLIAGITGIAVSQAPSTPAAKAPAAPRAARATYQPVGNVAQVMRGILFPNSNIIYAVQKLDPVGNPKANPPVKPLDVTPTEDYRDVYTGWEVVENAAIAIDEAANLLEVPGRVCSNGKPAPLARADWAKNVQTLRDAAKKTLDAAKAKNRDGVNNAAGDLTDACSVCHETYRDNGPAGSPARCTATAAK